MLEAVPVLEGTVGEQGMLEEPPNPAAPADAVVFAPCVELLGVSPGSCTAACGLTDGEALIPGAAPADTDPIVVAPAAPAVNDVDAFDDPVVSDEPEVDEATSDEPASQVSAIERLPMNEPPDVEQGVPGRLAPFMVVASNASGAEAALDNGVVADVLASDVVPFCEANWASAAAELASQMITKKPAMRCIEPS